MRTREDENTVIADETFEETLRELAKDNKITSEDALSLSTVLACVDVVSNTVAGLPVRMYRRTDGETEELLDDYRLHLLNDETGDLLDAFQWKKAVVKDYLIEGNGYTYVNKPGREIKSLHYIDHRSVSAMMNTDPIFKSCNFMINGKTFRDFEIMRILRNTKNGCTGIGIVEEANRPLSIMLDGLLYERSLFRTGARKGFLKSAKRLSETAMQTLTRAIRKLFSNDGDSVVVLNSGIEYQAAGQTAVETQLNEMKETNVAEICRMFCLSPRILTGGATEEDVRISMMYGIVPVVNALESALNRFCLLESEKRNIFIRIDRDEILQASLLQRYQAYEIAKRNGLLTTDEIREAEDYKPLGIDFINLGLDAVLYHPKTGQIYTPNTNQTTIMGKEAEANEDGNQGE